MSDRWADDHGISALSDADVVIARERLGLSQVQFARLLEVSKRTVERWETGERSVSSENVALIEGLKERADKLVNSAIKELARVSSQDRIFIIYRSDEHLRAHHPQAPLPASWIRAIAARVAAEAPFHVDVKFAPDAP